jgi:hypothetical protein
MAEGIRGFHHLAAAQLPRRMPWLRHNICKQRPVLRTEYSSSKWPLWLASWIPLNWKGGGQDVRATVVRASCPEPQEWELSGRVEGIQLADTVTKNEGVY